MSVFRLQIVTPEGLVFDDEVEKVIIRTVTGDAGILKNHANYVTAIKNGPVRIISDSTKKAGRCKNGIVSVMKDTTRIVANSFHWD